VRIKATSYDQLIIGAGICGPNTHAIFTGEANVNGVSESLTVEVNDCGEPSSGPPPDTFRIKTDSYENSGPLIEATSRSTSSWHRIRAFGAGSTARWMAVSRTDKPGRR